MARRHRKYNTTAHCMLSLCKTWALLSMSCSFQKTTSGGSTSTLYIEGSLQNLSLVDRLP